MNNNYNIRLVVEPDMPRIQILAVETFFESFNDGAKSEDIQLYLQNKMSYQNLISEFNAQKSINWTIFIQLLRQHLRYDCDYKNCYSNLKSKSYFSD